MTARTLVGSLVLACTFATPALAAWGPDGATIKATTNAIPKIAAVASGLYFARLATANAAAKSKVVVAR